MTTIINASTSSGLLVSTDNSGEIALQSNGATKATINSNGLSSPGHVIQVVDASSSTQISVTSGSATSAGFNLSITPKFSNSKLIVQGMLAAEAISSGGTDYGFKYQLYRNGSSVYNAEYDIYMSSNNNQRIQKLPVLFTQTANTTSALTFEIYFNNTGTSSNARLNYYGAPSKLIVMEIAQ